MERITLLSCKEKSLLNYGGKWPEINSVITLKNILTFEERFYSILEFIGKLHIIFFSLLALFRVSQNHLIIGLLVLSSKKRNLEKVAFVHYFLKRFDWFILLIFL